MRTTSSFCQIMGALMNSIKDLRQQQPCQGVHRRVRWGGGGARGHARAQHVQQAHESNGLGTMLPVLCQCRGLDSLVHVIQHFECLRPRDLSPIISQGQAPNVVDVDADGSM